MQGRIQDFKLEWAHLKKLRRLEGGAKMFGVFRVKHHDFTPQNHIFSNFRGRASPWTRPCHVKNVAIKFSAHALEYPSSGTFNI